MRILLCILIVGASANVGAQEAPKPASAHALLAKNAGIWDCEVKLYFRSPQGPPTEAKGLEENKLLAGGLYLQRSFTYPMRNRQFEGHSLMGYDPRAKKYVGTWVDNFTSAPSQVQGEYDENAKTLTVHNTVVDSSGNELKQKQVTTWLEESKKRMEIFLLMETGGKETEIKLMEMVATKRQ
jgi:hypothetical protein